MQNKNKFKGHVYFHNGSESKKILMKYELTCPEDQFHQFMMNSFKNLDFSFKEKAKLTRTHRRNLYQYLNLNLFELNQNANQWIELINNSKQNEINIEAYEYGAFICLTALYSGKLSKNKKINFNFDKSPLALFPSTLIKKNPAKAHQLAYQAKLGSWINNFETLYRYKSIDDKFKKSAWKF